MAKSQTGPGENTGLQYRRLVVAGDHVDPAAVAIEPHVAVHQGEEGVVSAAADAAAGVKPRAHLADQDAPCLDELAAESLDAPPLPAESRPLRLEPCPFLCAMSSFLTTSEVGSTHRIMGFDRPT